jgi:glycosyltransferase involved in cell wall biosynthesis
MSRRLRVAQVVLDLEEGGLERLVADLIRRLDPARFESHLVVLDFFGRHAQGLESVATLHLAPRLPPWTMVWPTPLERLFRAIAPDVVHTHSGVWYKASLAARRAGVPRLVHTDHGRARWPEPRLDRLVDRRAAARTDVVVAVSQALAEHLARRIVRDPRRLRVVANGVDMRVFAPRPDDGAVRRELGLGPDTPLLGSLGRLDPIKGHDVMLDALAQCRGQWAGGPAPVLLLAGDGPERARLERRARGLGPAVRFLGWRTDVRQILRALDVFTLSSYSEGTSVSLLEAMSAGVCPVVTDVGGNAAVLGPVLAHQLVPPGDPTALAGAWRRALADPAARARVGQQARRRVQQAFDLDAMVAGYARIYEGVEAAASPRAVASAAR